MKREEVTLDVFAQFLTFTNNKKMKKAILLLTVIFLFGCDNPPAAGTLEDIDHKEDSIEVYRYWYSNNGGWVYVSFFKNSPNVQTITWAEQQGKFRTTRANVVINPSRSYTLTSVKSKGVVLEKHFRDGGSDVGHYIIIIQTKDDVVKERITQEQYNILAEGDTIR